MKNFINSHGICVGVEISPTVQPKSWNVFVVLDSKRFWFQDSRTKAEALKIAKSVVRISGSSNQKDIKVYREICEIADVY